MKPQTKTLALEQELTNIVHNICPMELLPERICYRTGEVCYIKLPENRIECRDYREYLGRMRR